nr:hypothetical protein [Escherichia coli]
MQRSSRYRRFRLIQIITEQHVGSEAAADAGRTPLYCGYRCRY